MAELTAEQKRIAELEALVAQKEKALSRAKKDGVVSVPVSGSYEATWTDDATGKKVTKKVEFRDGAAQVRLPKSGIAVSTEGVLKIANGEKLNANETADENLKSLSKEEAQDLLTHLARIGYGLLK